MSNYTNNSKVYVYHERQQSALCARHCLNNLLQGPYFSEMDLSKIALQLDKEEQELLSKDDNNGLLEWLKNNKESQNVSMDGNFSIQVLKRALSNFGLNLITLGSDKSRSLNIDTHPENQDGFICNLQAHWFAVRKINNVWYNLNSLSGLPETPAKPCVITNFFLNAFLATLKNDGYSIYAVSGTYPKINSFLDNGTFNSNSNYYDSLLLTTRDKTYPKELLNQVNKSRMGQSIMGNNQNDMDLQRVLQESLNQYNNQYSNNNNNSNNYSSKNENDDLQRALQMSMFSTNTNNNNSNSNNNNSSNNNNNNSNNMEIDEDDELQQAKLMSLQQNFKDLVKDEPDDNVDKNLKCQIRLQLPNGKKLQPRYYLKNYLLQDVINYVKSIESFDNDLIFRSHPDTFKDPQITLDTICKKVGSSRLFLRVTEANGKQIQQGITQKKDEDKDDKMTDKN